ncbi:LPS-assembly lipoprotein [Bartonella fuyuanensis]|uniref:LPS-assembly lipoprotein n=1 Tax=Bartonella fuyuanensis TaxID=1460968 RepID=A0A840DYV9_9HYPH|nr:LPS assembly lipoprotein LptE [Bartonella fuyuanensis]MBB4075757.1 LPS-assembly lipoprotein [Bartonella fuyuanensis]
MLFFKNLIRAVLVGVLTLLGGCKVEPLYRQELQSSMTMDSATYVDSIAGHPSGRASLGLASKLASIVVEEPSDRFGQMVRNHLLFLLYGKGGKSSTPAYRLALQIAVFTRESMQIEIDFEKKRKGRPSVGTVMSRASYTLQDMKNTFVATGTATLNASFDRLRQEYATLQAEEDAKKRVAEELAEQIFLLLAKDLSNKTSRY